VSSAIEHKSVLAALAALERDGFRVTLVGVDRGGRVDPEDVRRALTPKTILVSVMAANNEIGTIEPVREIGRIARAAGVPFHTDATQAAGKVPFDVEADAVDLASFSAHKMYGPKGVGALYVRSRDPRVRLVPQIDGGGHERGLRSGTANVPGIVGFGAAAEIAAREREADARHLGALRDRLLKGLLEGLDGVTVNGSLEHRLPHNLNVSLSMVESESLLKRLDHIAVSSGAACASANPEPSYVLRAIGVREELIHGAVRFGLGRTNTAGEIGRAAAAFVGEARRLRALSPLYRLAGEEGPGSSIQWEDAPALRKGDS
jgi:cysteine desulfurase